MWKVSGAQTSGVSSSHAGDYANGGEGAGQNTVAGAQVRAESKSTFLDRIITGLLAVGRGGAVLNIFTIQAARSGQAR